jgi:hypothetical protein
LQEAKLLKIKFKGKRFQKIEAVKEEEEEEETLYKM